MKTSIKNSIEYKNDTINFSFNTGALKYLRDLGYDIDYNDIMKGITDLGSFCADFLFCCAKFHARKDPSFNYDRDDAHDWIPIFGGLESVISALATSATGGIVPTIQAVPNEKKEVGSK